MDDIVFYIHDHLGNTRLTYKANIDNCGISNDQYTVNTTYTLQYVGDYFPYGKVLRKYVNSEEKYILTGNEREYACELDYFNARFLDVDLARFNGVDALASQFPSQSPFMSMDGNPVMLVDPSGLSATKYVTEAGTPLVETDDGSNVVATVTDEKADEFYESYKNASKEEVNSQAWNFKMKSMLSGVTWNQAIENNQSHWATDVARRNAFRYIQTGDINYLSVAISSHTAVYRNDLISWAIGLTGGFYGAAVVAESMVAKGATSVPRNSLSRTHYITKSKSEMRILLNDIRENGIQKTIKFVEYNGTKYIVDGHHRYYAAQKLGIQNIPTEQVSLPYNGYKSVMDLMLEPGKNPGYWKYIK
jgi:RHS repeat-associated protein